MTPPRRYTDGTEALPPQTHQITQCMPRASTSLRQDMTLSAGCEHAVESNADLGAAPLDVACKCGSAFCFQCKEEAHRPVGAFAVLS